MADMVNDRSMLHDVRSRGSTFSSHQTLSRDAPDWRKMSRLFGELMGAPPCKNGAILTSHHRLTDPRQRTLA